MSSNVIQCIIGVSLLTLSARPVWALDLYSGAKPQSQSNTCQSYSAVLALAAKGDPAFPVDTFEELRALEHDFRNILETLPGGDPYSHTNWPKAMEALTGGKYTINLNYVNNDLVNWLSQVRARTTIKNNLDQAIATLSGSAFDTVMTSVIEIGGSPYPKGHIVTLLGVLGTGVNSDTRLIAFNSAVKGQGGSVSTCSTGDEPGDYHYKAGVVETQSFHLKQFSSKLLLMELVKKQ